MRFLAFVALLALLLVPITSCGPSVTQTCTDYSVAYCNRHYACDTGPALDNLKAKYGATAQDCATTYASVLYLDCTSTQAACPVGTSYDTGAEETCITDFGKLSCTDLTSNVVPPSCAPNLICH